MKKNDIVKRIAKIIYRSKLALLKNKITPKKFINYSNDINIEKHNAKLQCEKVEKILEKYSSNPEKLIDYIKRANTSVYIVRNTRFLTKIALEQGFIVPQKGLKALYLNLILNKKISFETPEMFVIETNFSSYLFTYEFYKWYCYKTGTKGYENETQIKFQKVFNFSKTPQIEDLTFDEIIELKTAIKRDIEAIEFVKNYSIKHSGVKNAFGKIIQGKSASI